MVKSRLIFSCRRCAIFFYKHWLIKFYYCRGCFFVRCCRKNLQSTSARFFRSTSMEVVVRLTATCFHLLGIKNISPPRKKTWFADTKRKNASRRRRGKINYRGLKKKHHRMTPIEHFLLAIIQILFRDWIQNTITDIGLCKVATHIFLPTLSSFFDKRWPIIFFYTRGCFFVRCCRKNLQSTSARLFRSTSTEVVVRPKTACFHLFGNDSISPPRKKTWFTDTARKKC